MTEDEKPFKTEFCAGCICVAWRFAGNQRGFCSGIVKEPKPEEDVLRLCFLDKERVQAVDLGLDEGLTVSAILASCASDYVEKYLRKGLRESEDDGKL